MEQKRCNARQANNRASDFECKLSGAAGHTVHVDPKTGTRWSEGGPPRGMRRKYEKKYANRKLSRQSKALGRS